MDIYEQGHFATLAEKLNHLIEQFVRADAEGGAMWKLVTAEYDELIHGVARLLTDPLIVRTQPPDLRRLAALLNELESEDAAFKQAIDRLEDPETRPSVPAGGTFDAARHAPYLALIPRAPPHARKTYLRFDRCAQREQMRTMLEQSRSHLPPCGGQLSHRLDGRHFSAPLSGTSWTVDSRGTLNLTLRPVPEIPTTFAHPLVPLSAGLWDVGIEPPKLNFVDKDGGSHVVTAPRRPLLLKVTWLLLFLMFLPALLWCLAPLLRCRPRAAAAPKQLPLPEIPAPTLPAALRALPPPLERRWPPVPTLFIGLGGAGRRALHAIRADLRQAHLGAADAPYRFCWLDADTKEQERWHGHDSACGRGRHGKREPLVQGEFGKRWYSLAHPNETLMTGWVSDLAVEKK